MLLHIRHPELDLGRSAFLAGYAHAPFERRLLTSACHVGVLGWSMHQRWQDPWIEGEDADPFLALLAMLAIGAIAAGIALLLIH
jgi:hypothetical protein